MWGAEDLVASLGATSSRRPDGGYRDVARHARRVIRMKDGRVLSDLSSQEDAVAEKAGPQAVASGPQAVASASSKPS